MTRALCLLCCLAGCGAERPATDTDGGTNPNHLVSCAAPSGGRAFYVTRFELLREGEGFDLDGDDEPDNAVARARGFIDFAYSSWFATDGVSYLVHFPDLPPAPLPGEGTSLAGAIYQAFDTTSPPDHAAKLDGRGAFLVPGEQLDVDCNPTSAFDHVTVHGGELELRARRVRFALAPQGFAEYEDLQATATLAPDGKTVDMRWGAVLTACVLSRVPSLLNGQAGQVTMLSLLAGLFMIAPDFDLGQGLGAFDVTPNFLQLRGCTDAHGTSIPGADCACDPRMNVGYSFAAHLTGVAAHVVGLTPER